MTRHIGDYIEQVRASLSKEGLNPELSAGELVKVERMYTTIPVQQAADEIIARRKKYPKQAIKWPNLGRR